ncbi:MAG: hypothetical protein ABIR00_06110 [Nitrosospira sp.]
MPSHSLLSVLKNDEYKSKDLVEVFYSHVTAKQVEIRDLWYP